jgi:hypothetical protein
MSAVGFWLEKQLTDKQIRDYEHLSDDDVERLAEELNLEDIENLKREEIIEGIIESGHDFKTKTIRDFLRDEVVDDLQNRQQGAEDFLRAINSITTPEAITILNEPVINNPANFIDNLFQVRKVLTSLSGNAYINNILSSLDNSIKRWAKTGRRRVINVQEDWGPERLKSKDHVLQYLDIWLTKFIEELGNTTLTAQGKKIYGPNMGKVISKLTSDMFHMANNIYNGKWGEEGEDVHKLLHSEVEYLDNDFQERTDDLLSALRNVRRIYKKYTIHEPSKLEGRLERVMSAIQGEKKTIKELRDKYHLSNTKARNIYIFEKRLQHLTEKINDEEVLSKPDEEAIRDWLKDKENVQDNIDRLSQDYVGDNKVLYRKLQDLKEGKTVVW